jgi:glycine/D-amino acid oxidase-like deaminating enzyme
MSGESPAVAVVGAGVFGVTAAIELARRGFRVELIDPGPLPSPDASSTDINKAVRVDYGADEFYTILAERALEGWRAWNQERGEQLFLEAGFLLMTSTPLEPGEFEGDSFDLLERRGLEPRRLDAAARAEMFPAWKATELVDGLDMHRASRRGGSSLWRRARGRDDPPFRLRRRRGRGLDTHPVAPSRRSYVGLRPTGGPPATG